MTLFGMTPRMQTSVVSTIFFILTFALPVGGFIAPIFYSSMTLQEKYGGATVDKFIEKHKEGLEYREVYGGNYPINWLVEGTWSAHGGLRGLSEGRHAPDFSFSADTRPERLFSLIAIWASIYLAAFFYHRNSIYGEPPKDRTKYMGFEMPDVDGTVEGSLRLEMKNAWLITQRAYRGSLALLAAGTSMAFVGIFVFFASAPDFASLVDGGAPISPDHWAIVISIVRPLGLLVFLEAVAWFLLRQYRSSTEDFKAFFRIYLKRSNYFTARKAYSEIETSEKSLLIAAALIAEDLSGHLSAGQSTEAIEAMKVDDNNPVFSIIADTKNRLLNKFAPQDKRPEASAKPPDDKTATEEKKSE